MGEMQHKVGGHGGVNALPNGQKQCIKGNVLFNETFNTLIVSDKMV